MRCQSFSQPFEPGERPDPRSPRKNAVPHQVIDSGCGPSQDFLPHLTYIECRIPKIMPDSLDTIVEALGDAGFVEPVVVNGQTRARLSILFVCNEVEVVLEVLQRNLLRADIRQVVGTLMDSECELEWSL